MDIYLCIEGETISKKSKYNFTLSAVVFISSFIAFASALEINVNDNSNN